MAKVIEMSVLEWIAVRDNPRQRNTLQRAKIASRKHLRTYHKVHAFVFAACKQGSVLCKLDGHTRAALWQSGELSPPHDGKVTVCLIEVANMAEAKMVYDMLDAAPSVKKPSDTIYGACRENAFVLQSHLLRSCAFATQLKIATTGKRFSGDIYAMVKEWKQELIELDSWGLSSNYTVLISVMLVSIRRDQTTARAFWESLDTNSGSKTQSGYDGPLVLHDVIEVRRAEGRTAGYENLLQLCGQAWSAYELFLRGARTKNCRLRFANFTEVVQSVKSVAHE